MSSSSSISRSSRRADVLSRFSCSARWPSSLWRARIDRSLFSTGSYADALSRKPSVLKALSDDVSFSFYTYELVEGSSLNNAMTSQICSTNQYANSFFKYAEDLQVGM